MRKRRDLPTQYIGKAAMMSDEIGLQHLVYDLSIDDINQRKNKVIICDSVLEVAELLGVKTDVIFRNRIVGKRVKALNGKFYAVRVLKK